MARSQLWERGVSDSETRGSRHSRSDAMASAVSENRSPRPLNDPGRLCARPDSSLKAGMDLRE
jgi:hypothetical protein